MALLLLATQGEAATVFVNEDTQINSDPNANPAIIFTAASNAVISSSLIIGDILTTRNQGTLVLNGATHINGNIGSSRSPISRLITGRSGQYPLLTKNGDVYILDGAIYTRIFAINDGLAFTRKSSTIELGGNVDTNFLLWREGGGNTVTTLDLHGHVLKTTLAVFTVSEGTLRLISSITSAGGQTACNTIGNSAGCIKATQNGTQPLRAGAPTSLFTLPAGQEVHVRIANGVQLTKGSKYTLIDFGTETTPVPPLPTPLKSLFHDVVFSQDTSNTEDLVIMVSELPTPVAPTPNISTDTFTTPMFVDITHNPVAHNADAELDALSATATEPTLIDAITAIQNAPVAIEEDILNRVPPDTSLALERSSQQAVHAALNPIRERMAHWRSSPFAAANPIRLASIAEVPQLPAEENETLNQVWLKGFAARGQQQQHNDYAPYRNNTQGYTLGIDHSVNPDLLFGVAMSVAHGEVIMQGFRTGDKSQILTYQFTTYGGQYFDHWYWQGWLSYAQQTYDIQHNIGLIGQANSQLNGHNLNSQLSVGAPISVAENWQLTPTLGLESNWLSQDSYSEQGADPLALHVEARSVHRLASLLGLNLASKPLFSDSFFWTPSLHANWRHDFYNNGMDSRANFINGGTSFITPGQALPSDSAQIGASLSIQPSKNFSLNVSIDAEQTQSYQAWGGQISALWQF